MIHSTEKGLEVFKKSLDYKFFKELYKPLTSEEFEQLEALLFKLHDVNAQKLRGKDVFDLTGKY